MKFSGEYSQTKWQVNQMNCQTGVASGFRVVPEGVTALYPSSHLAVTCLQFTWHELHEQLNYKHLKELHLEEVKDGGNRRGREAGRNEDRRGTHPTMSGTNRPC